jgi:ATP-binding cassette subfamily C protein CydC
VRQNLNWTADGSDVSDADMIKVLGMVELYSGTEGENILNKQAKDLSGGQQQRLSLARMLLDDSPIIILDEPMTGVDVYTIKKILPHLEKKIKDSKRTFIIISHKLLFAKYADQIILFDENCKLREVGEPEALVKNTESVFYSLIEESKRQLEIK